MPKPAWLRKRIGVDTINALKVEHILKEGALHTVCESAMCPNISECFNQGTATFLILGDVCTRNCRFCAIKKGKPESTDPEEPKKIARAVESLGLKYVVITSVTRDDLPRGGAEEFRDTVIEIKRLNRNVNVEVLTPDFRGDKEALFEALSAGPDVLNHNIETVPSLYPTVRPMADFERSLNILYWAKEYNNDIITKSGIMVGLGETDEELYNTFKMLADVGCDILTIGQYLQPTREHLEVREYVTPEKFQELERLAYKSGLKYVVSGVFVRSSYFAHKGYEKILEVKNRCTDS
ncbi:MAG TPA: lipoyl synthase [bacterium]|nr:lipoyl synthase [bacterium]HOK29039.1 lipoyl synthase [bacterium]HOL54658.1 lipoyl synthase [bacterium]HPC76827.1 lipoyl synthase [bacterium]HPO81415.1 lipoyl synthase [bacterium]